jgi:hypothetical protein
LFLASKQNFCTECNFIIAGLAFYTVKQLLNNIAPVEVCGATEVILLIFRWEQNKKAAFYCAAFN